MESPVAAPIGDPALVCHQRMMPGNLLVDGVHPVWVAVGQSKDMLPDDGLCPTKGHTLWAKGADQQAIVAGAYHQLLALEDGSCVPMPTIVLRVYHNAGRRALRHVLGGHRAGARGYMRPAHDVGQQQ